MTRDTEAILDFLVDRISSIEEVQSIGISGSKTPLPKAGEGDIDIFIYCDTTPEFKKRQDLRDIMGDLMHEWEINAFEGGHWGTGDYALINGVETWMMYFTTDKTISDIESILNGNYPDKLDNYYYPVGRCAMLENISILYDREGFLQSMKDRLSEYPDKLAERLIRYHMEALEDTEDLERAVNRKDVLFYHFSLDIAIDHFLQALFAINRTYFPSRKRSLDFIERFDKKPDRCSERLLEVVKLGGFDEGIEKSYEIWCNLVSGIKSL